MSETADSLTTEFDNYPRHKFSYQIIGIYFNESVSNANISLTFLLSFLPCFLDIYFRDSGFERIKMSIDAIQFIQYRWRIRGGSPLPNGTQFFRFRVRFRRKVPASPLRDSRPQWEILEPPLCINYM